MARPLRIDPPGSFHHVMNRGADGQITFRDDTDRELFLEILARGVAKFGIEVHAYCLMPNHYHLLVRSPDGQLSRAMKFIGQSYTQRFNRRHGRDGALFRGRFHSVLVDSERYLDIAARYIHRNPVTKRAKSLGRLDRYRWSSLPAYERRAKAPSWLTTAEVLHRFSNRRAYGDFVRRDVNRSSVEQFYNDPFRQRHVLGDRAFVRRIQELVGERAAGLRPGASP